MKETFITTELYLACYLKANGAEFRNVEKGTADKCNFIFYQSDLATKLMNKWYSSETDNVRILLQVNTDLRYQLRQCINNIQTPEWKRRVV